MTKEQLENLKAGDTVKYIDSDKTFLLEEDHFTISDYKGSPILYIMQGQPDSLGNALWLPYYYYELELINSRPLERQCTCDIMLLMRAGCKCKGV